MSIPTVLVLMPIYNAARFLRAAVDSVLAQSFRDFRLLAVDDGSTDASAATLAEYDDPRLVIEHRVHTGLVSALNHGIARARELLIPFIARMDADDWSDPARLEKQMVALANRPDAAACSCNCSYIDDEDRLIGSSTVPLSPTAIGWELRHGLRGMVHGASLFRTEALTAVGGFRPQFQHAEDVDLFLRLSERYQLTNVSEFLYRIRLDPGSTSVANARRNSLYGLYAIDCARRRARGIDEISYDSFTQQLSWSARLRLRHEDLLLRLWRRGLDGSATAKLVAALVDPKRVAARLWRTWERR